MTRNRQRILLVDDDDLILTMLGRGLREEGYDVRTNAEGKDLHSMISGWRPDVILLDIHLPDRSGIEALQELNRSSFGLPVIMLTADQNPETAVAAMKQGASDYVLKPFDLDEVSIVIRNVLERERLKQEVDFFRRTVANGAGDEIIGGSPAVRAVKAELEQIAEASVPTILITGESGTGKELFARYAHRLMHTRENGEYIPFVRINCAALPEQLLESELFGHEKGTFTDAKTDRKGLLELAHGGTILLDEIGEMKPSLQSKLLRVLEERTVRHIGGRCEIPIQVTVIATTNRDLADGVDRGEFRMDLFYRLNAFCLKIPPLRERRDDIPLLARHFLSLLATKYNKKLVKMLSAEAEAVMTAYPWPGNVRELKNIIERSVVLGGKEDIQVEHLPPEMRGSGPPVLPDPHPFALPEQGICLEDLEKSLILQALGRTNFNKSQAAKLLHVNYDMIRYYSKKFGLDRQSPGDR